MMFTIAELIQPHTVEEAYNALLEKPDNTILGGCAFLRLGSKKIATAIDLSQCNLSQIIEREDEIELGAAVTYRAVETAPVFSQYFNGVLPRAVGHIIGVQFRNTVTVGASVYSKYGFSDFITALLALDAEVELFKAGRMTLAEFLEKPYSRDILTRIFIKKEARVAAYQDLRTSASDFPILNAAVSRLGDAWTVVVGARPLKAQIAKAASQALSAAAPGQIDASAVAAMAAEELTFGNNAKASADYRKAMCEVLVKRAIKEVLACK
jgi:CO/xanthine dehydrogenase FAD-binding subunit